MTGPYPPGIDASLRGDFDQRLRAAAIQTTELRAALARARAAGHFEERSRRHDGRLKAAYARAVEAVVGFALRDVLRQLNEHRAALDEVLDLLVEQVEDRNG